VELTESETEYTVSVVKHILANYIILQFNVTNTLKDQLLQNVTVKVSRSLCLPVVHRFVFFFPACVLHVPKTYMTCRWISVSCKEWLRT
jgi:coatomer protein complex subunit gamma